MDNVTNLPAIHASVEDHVGGGLLEEKPIVAYCDGSLMTKGSAAFVVYSGKRKLFSHAEILKGGQLCNVTCEYVAMVRMLEGLIDQQLIKKPIKVFTDYQGMTDAIKGKKITTGLSKSATLLKLHLRVLELAEVFSDIEIDWMPRCLNTEAHELAHFELRKVLYNGSKDNHHRRLIYPRTT